MDSHVLLMFFCLIGTRVEPLLYRVLNLSNVDHAAAVLASLNAKSDSFLAAAVRHVLVYASTRSLDPAALESLLESCPGIVGLSIIGNVAGPNLLPVLGNMHIQRLSADLEQLFREDDDAEESAVDLQHSLFAALTHLDVLDDIDVEDEEPQALEWLRHLSTLPALTHLSFSSTPPNPQIVDDVLRACPLIHVLIVAFSISDKEGPDTYLEHSSISDIRFVMVAFVDYYRDWELGARGGEDIWVRAEEFISRKKGGDLEADNYLLDLSIT
ncbi:hypothetical protein K438DRAFT_1965139 [Mycena galopus ATCC 62051]|nr:hypothetical protein K438DRAFT_1965139 [Mycena galopus ATCC 62051]